LFFFFHFQFVLALHYILQVYQTPF
jgi:hypothetical protein